MYCHAAFWFLLPEVTHSAIEPLQPGSKAAIPQTAPGSTLQ